MKIVFVGMDSRFTESMGYQENFFAHICAEKKYETVFISGNEEYVNGIVVDTGREDRFLDDGIHLYRVPYLRIGPKALYKKLRLFRGVYQILRKEEPDVIYCHNTQYSSVLDVVKYKKKHPTVRIYADTHVEANNSGRNWLSLHILHRIYYRFFARKLVPFLERYYCTCPIAEEFAFENYKIPKKIMEILPLGGICETDGDYQVLRNKFRKENNFCDDDIVLLHTGKLDELKKTDILCNALSAVSCQRLKLIIVGSIPKERERILKQLFASDDRIQYLGWKSLEEMRIILCGADLYCQPGSPSATLQQAICARCAILAKPDGFYEQLDTGNFMWVYTQADIEDSLNSIIKGEIDFHEMMNNSIECAKTKLDYYTQVERFVNS